MLGRVKGVGARRPRHAHALRGALRVAAGGSAPGSAPRKVRPPLTRPALPGGAEPVGTKGVPPLSTRRLRRGSNKGHPFAVLAFWQSVDWLQRWGNETGSVDGLPFVSIFAWFGREGHNSPLPSWLSGLSCAPWPFRSLIALCRAGPGSGMGYPRPWQPERLDALKAAKLTQTGTCQRVSINRADPGLSTGKVIHSVKF